MNKGHYTSLIELGLTRNESEVYVALVQLGAASVQDVARQASIRRTSVYSVLEALSKRGFVHKTIRGTKHLYTAERPRTLTDRYTAVLREWSEAAEVLERCTHSNAQRSDVQMFEGSEGFKKIWRAVLTAPIREYEIITNPEEMLLFAQKGYITSKIIDEKRKKQIRSRQLIPKTTYAQQIVAKDAQENRVSKFLPHGYPYHGTMILFGDTVAHFGTLLDEAMFVVVSEQYAESQRSLFNILWDMLPSVRTVRL